MDACEAACEAVTTLLLRICADPDGDPADAMAAMRTPDWASAAAIAREQRISPLVLRALRRSAAAASVPGGIMDDLQARDRWHRLHALRQAAGIGKLAGRLSAAGFRPLFLKGAALAHGAYPAPAERPLRDVDLLLPPDEAMRAHAFLLGTGAYDVPSFAAHHTADAPQHLKPLVDRDFGLAVEVHHRLGSHAPWAGEARLEECLWRDARSVAIAGQDVLVPSIRANFLHIIEHATLAHLFENGPLTLSDLHYLARSEAMDWESLMAEADAMGLGNALALVAAVAARFGAKWAPPALLSRTGEAQRFVGAASQALLQTVEDVELNKLLRRLARNSGGGARLRDALAKAFRPDPLQIVHLADGKGALIGYARWAKDRTTRYWRARRRAPPAGRKGELAAWLTDA